MRSAGTGNINAKGSKLDNLVFKAQLLTQHPVLYLKYKKENLSMYKKVYVVFIALSHVLPHVRNAYSLVFLHCPPVL